MCGLNGVAGEVTPKEESIFKTLLHFSAVRGMDSTGAACVDRHAKDDGFPKILLSKETGPPCFLADLKSYDDLFRRTPMCLIGHNRSKTVGEITRRNAHPFRFENIVGAHNGTIDYSNRGRIDKSNQFKTDSEAIFNSIEIIGLDETISLLETTEAWALVWYDRRDNSINFLRNSHRPLLYCFCNKRKTIFWASEYHILRCAIERMGLDIDDEKVFQPSEDVHYKYIIPKVATEPFGEPVRTNCKGKEPPVKGFTYYENGKKNTGTTKGMVAGGTGYKSSAELLDDDITDMEYEGLYTGWVPKNKSSNNNNLPAVQSSLLDRAQGSIKAAIDKLEGKSVDRRASVTVLDRQKDGKTLPTNLISMAASDLIKRRALDHARSAGQIPQDLIKTPMIFNSSTLTVYYDKENISWTSIQWNKDKEEWDTYKTSVPPLSMGCKIVDINARHEFKHVGRGKHKKIYYKAFGRTPLDRNQFDGFMSCGCLNCTRKPEWGNLVCFVSQDQSFLCEYCMTIPGMKERWLSAGQINDELNNKKRTA